MSSYISGAYNLTNATADLIRTQAMRELRYVQSELRILQDRIKENEQAQNAMLLERKNREEGRVKAEQVVAESMSKRQEKEKARRQAAHEEVQALLAAAEERLAKLDDDIPEKQALNEKVRCMRDSVELFGDTEQSVEAIRTLVRVTIPDMLAQVQRDKEKRQLEHMAQETLQARGAVVDRSLRFVSLSIQAEEKESIDRPWDVFVSRIRKLAEKQSIIGASGAEKLLQEIALVSPDKQNMYMFKHREQVTVWEEEVASLDSTNNENEEKRQELYQTYQALHSMCGEINTVPLLPAETSYDRLILEHDRLLGMYLERRNQQYIEKAFREVFEAHGLVFESVNIDEQNNVQIEFTLDEEAGIRVLRNANGAFDMIFFGNSSAQHVSQDQRRKVTEKAHGFCHMMPSISRELQNRGITFQQQWVQEPTEDAIVFEVKQGNQNHIFRENKALYLE